MKKFGFISIFFLLGFTQSAHSFVMRIEAYEEIYNDHWEVMGHVQTTVVYYFNPLVNDVDPSPNYYYFENGIRKKSVHRKLLVGYSDPGINLHPIWQNFEHAESIYQKPRNEPELRGYEPGVLIEGDFASQFIFYFNQSISITFFEFVDKAASGDLQWGNGVDGMPFPAYATLYMSDREIPLPEPDTIWLVLTGLICLGLGRYKVRFGNPR